jgi:hypothetical protein
MTEAGGLIVAAIIAGAVAIIAAIITGVVSFLSLITSKEQSVSEHRQQWIDALRKDIAIIVGRVIAIQGESIAMQQGEGKLRESLKQNWTGFHRVIVRIRLRLNPKEDRPEEKQPTKDVLTALDELESIFSSAKPRLDLLQPLIKTLVDGSQVILKENWDRVRDGEPVYQTAKRNTWIAVKIFAWLGVIGVVATILYGLHWFKVI